MKFWLSKNGDVSLRDQLTRQIILAIVSGDLRAGDRLPSVREIALRHKIHANTASAAYRRLEEDGWVASRIGSGVYVRQVAQTKLDETAISLESELDAAISAFLNEMRGRGFEDGQIKAQLDRRLKNRSPRKIFVAESDKNLAQIFACELAERFSLPVSIANISEPGVFPKSALVVSLSDPPAPNLAAAAFVRLKLNSVQESMRGQQKPAQSELIGIVSHWEMFLRWSQTMLIAVGIEEENLVVRNAADDGWQNGLSLCRFVVTDSLTAQHLPDEIEKRVFRLISDESIAEIKNHCK